MRIQAQGRIVMFDGEVVLPLTGQGRTARCFGHGVLSCRPDLRRKQHQTQ